MMKSKTMLKSLLFFFLYFAFTFSSSAQSVTPFTESVSIVVNPQNPRPGETVSLSLQSSAVNLSDSTIIWKKNGKTEKQGVDVRDFSFVAGNNGSTTKVDVSIQTKNLGTITKTLSFSPGEVTILYEAKTYTPPFYKGKALASPQSVISLMALTNFKTSSGATISPSNLIYSWSKDDTPDANNSGRGKNTYQYNNGALSTEAPLLEVTVTSPDSNVSGKASFRITNVNPEIIFYEDNPLRGVILESALVDTFNLKKSEASLVAYPFFFSTTKKENSNFLYHWSINGEPITNSKEKPATLTIRRPEERGVSGISLKLENSGRIFQVANNAIDVSYGN